MGNILVSLRLKSLGIIRKLPYTADVKNQCCGTTAVLWSRKGGGDPLVFAPFSGLRRFKNEEMANRPSLIEQGRIDWRDIFGHAIQDAFSFLFYTLLPVY